METVFLAKIPIFNREEKIFGFDIKLDYETSEKVDFNSLLRKIYTVLSDSEIIKSLQGKVGFINLPTDIIVFTDFTSLIPKDNFVIKITDQQTTSKVLMDKIKELSKNGYKFCLYLSDDRNLNQLSSLKEYISYIEIDSQKLSNIDPIKVLKQNNLAVILDSIDSYEDFDRFKKVGGDLFKGEFFTKPQKIEANLDNFSKLETLKLIRLVHEEDDLNVIADYIKGSPNLSLNLLKYINSSFFYLANPITSVNRAVIYLGKKNLLNWLLLVSMISAANVDTKRELIKRALFRGKFMELISKKINNDEIISDTSFLVGILSFVESIFNVPLEVILKELNLNENIAREIREKSGFFGKILTLTEEVETQKNKNIKKLSEKLLLDPSEVADITIEALKWSESMISVLH
ncbi:MAG: HDOD domain-containing protein [Hydrogenothermaceae bacterium]